MTSPTTTATEPDEFNRDLIDGLSMDNHIVHSYLIAHEKGWLTYEQALIGMVSSLVSRNDELVRLSEDLEKTPSFYADPSLQDIK